MKRSEVDDWMEWKTYGADRLLRAAQKTNDDSSFKRGPLMSSAPPWSPQLAQLAPNARYSREIPIRLTTKLCAFRGVRSMAERLSN